MPRAAAFSAFGGPDVLGVVEIDEPRPGPGQVRVRVRAAGVQPFDCAVRQGWTPAHTSLRFPQILGNEFAGVIDGLGDGVSGFAVGEEVLGFTLLSAYAEVLVVAADQVVPKPPEMPWEVAGGFTAGAQTAHMALSTLGVGAGDTVLIHAAAGTVGTVAVQLARHWGAETVIGTASPPNHDYLTALGAIPVAYGEGLVDRVRAIAPGGIDAALDAAGGDALRASVELVADRRRVLTIVDYALVDELGVRTVQGSRSAARLAEMVDLYTKGALRIHVRKTYPLEAAADAHRDVGSGHGRGKVVLTMGGEAS